MVLFHRLCGGYRLDKQRTSVRFATQGSEGFKAEMELKKPPPGSSDSPGGGIAAETAFLAV